jgi:hypothetical protein
MPGGLNTAWDAPASLADYERSLGIQQSLAAGDPQDVSMKVEAAKLLNTAAPGYGAAGRRGNAMTSRRPLLQVAAFQGGPLILVALAILAIPFGSAPDAPP